MKKILVLFLLFFVCGIVSAFEVKGRAVDEVTGEPVEGILIKIVGEGQEVYTDSKGEFIFSTSTVKDVKDRITLSAEITGYRRHEEIYKAPYKDIVIEFVLGTELTMEKIVIREKSPKSTGTKHELGSKNVTRTTTHLFSDTMKILHTLPGVVAASDFSSVMYIRGGSAYELLSLLDNVLITNPYIWGGIESIFNPNFVDTVDFYSGGFPAKYPQALSAILDVKNKEGDYRKNSGFAELGVTTIELLMDGPMRKDKSSYLFGVRRTQYDLLEIGRAHV